MKTRIALLALGLVIGLGACSNPADDVPAADVSSPAPEAAATMGAVYTIDDSSSVGFIGSKVTGSHEGGFNQFDGEISLVDGDPTKSTVMVEIDTTSLWADNDKLTGHLMSPDFFDVATYPQATFTSTEIVEGEEGYQITGNLDLHGVTNSITFPAQIEVLGDKIVVQSEFSINRFDFGIEFKGAADDLIRDEVVIKLDLSASPEGSIG